MSIKQLRALIRTGIQQSSDKQLDHYGTEIGLLLLSNPHLLNYQWSRQQKTDALALIIRSTHDTVIAQRKTLIELLNVKHFAQIKPSNHQLLPAIEFAIKTQNSKLFQALLEHPSSISDNHLISLVDRFFNDEGDLMKWDLFHKLDPKQYQSRAYRTLSPYEKLYYQVYEYYYVAELNHRLNLGGRSHIKWGKKNIYKIDSKTGQDPGCGLMQLKNHLLLFIANNNKLSPGFTQAVNEILELTPQSGCHYFNKSTENKKNIFYFNHSHHIWCAFYVDNKLYMINMGYGSETPGIQVYDVPNDKVSTVLNTLTAWENRSLLDTKMSYKHFRNFAQKHNLTQLEQIDIPAQTVDNCSYYSLKGLLLAMSYHYNQAHYAPQMAYDKSLRNLLAFNNYDYANAIEDYLAHSIHPNFPLLERAKAQAKKYEFHPWDLLIDETQDEAAYQKMSF
ncbi:hypothetical protein [Candidatus Berkiella aquae]|uniref:Uncharacterized protein n=1 Tax=Candidatus Berkiella aquae TaxID=295108 RepID=A0A0Q9YV34_9GAMM|nr:hypothetical protein [Candidatus Berkiella aquae]MCS5710906.1 hypothetical protein [Candidatus Berkiella aquae]